MTGYDLFIFLCFFIIPLIVLAYIVYDKLDPFAKNRRKKRLKIFKNFHKDRLARFKIREKHLKRYRDIRRKYR